jgi:hypothetical protein
VLAANSGVRDSIMRLLPVSPGVVVSHYTFVCRRREGGGRNGDLEVRLWRFKTTVVQVDTQAKPALVLQASGYLPHFTCHVTVRKYVGLTPSHSISLAEAYLGTF